MKQHNINQPDELRAEYKRSDFGLMTRGRYSTLSVQEPSITELKESSGYSTVDFDNKHALAA